MRPFPIFNSCRFPSDVLHIVANAFREVIVKSYRKELWFTVGEFDGRRRKRVLVKIIGE